MQGCKKIEVSLRFSLTKVNSEAADSFFYRLIFAADKLFFWEVLLGSTVVKNSVEVDHEFLDKTKSEIGAKGRIQWQQQRIKVCPNSSKMQQQ